METLECGARMRRPTTAKTVIGVTAVCALLGSGCRGDDDDTADPTITPAPIESTEAAVVTISPPTTVPPTTLPPTTTVDIEALKSQIAADYQRSWQLRNELSRNPTLENLDERIAQISAPGSEDAMDLKEVIEDAVATGERTVPGDPDLFRIDVENIEISGSPPSQAVITVCFVGNANLVDSQGNVINGGLMATRSRETVVPTANGRLPNGFFIDLWGGSGVAECPPA